MTSTEGTSGKDNLGEWLTKWDLQAHEQALRSKGIKKPSDFEYIKTKKNFDALIANLGDDVSFMDALKLEDAWKSMVPEPEQPKPQIYFLGDKEKDIMSKLYERFDDLSEDVNVIQKAFNGMTYMIFTCVMSVTTCKKIT